MGTGEEEIDTERLLLHMDRKLNVILAYVEKISKDTKEVRLCAKTK